VGYAIFFLIMAVIVAMVANSKGRYAFGWFFYGLLIWPIALVHALLLKRVEPQRIQTEGDGHAPTRPCSNPGCFRVLTADQTECPCGTTTPLPERASDERECPHCAELIKAKAIKCKHCGSQVEPEVMA
jgi:hypothetical protein